MEAHDEGTIERSARASPRRWKDTDLDREIEAIANLLKLAAAARSERTAALTRHPEPTGGYTGRFPPQIPTT
jgi:hypothetical protein